MTWIVFWVYIIINISVIILRISFIFIYIIKTTFTFIMPTYFLFFFYIAYFLLNYIHLKNHYFYFYQNYFEFYQILPISIATSNSRANRISLFPLYRMISKRSINIPVFIFSIHTFIQIFIIFFQWCNLTSCLFFVFFEIIAIKALWCYYFDKQTIHYILPYEFYYLYPSPYHYYYLPGLMQ